MDIWAIACDMAAHMKLALPSPAEKLCRPEEIPVTAEKQFSADEEGVNCPICNRRVAGCSCASCGWRPWEPDATGTEEPLSYPDESPLGPWTPEED